LQSAYHDTIKGVESKYGQHDTAPPITFCTGDDVECSDPQYWMLGLLDKNRTVETFWTAHHTNPYPNGVAVIEVEAIAEGLNKGYIRCAFEFAGFDAYLDAAKAKQNSNF